MFHKNKLSRLASANGFTLWHYLHAGDINDVEEKDFFKKATDIVASNDLILVNANNGNSSLWVMSTVNRTVEVQVNMLPAIHTKETKNGSKRNNSGNTKSDKSGELRKRSVRVLPNSTDTRRKK